MPKFISEGAIFQEAELIKVDPKKAIFRMTMQTVDEPNQNKRIYPRNVLTEGMEQTRDRVERRAFLGELDHPIPTGEGMQDGIRQTTVMLKEVSHIIRDFEFRGRRLVGELETADTPNGRILLGLLKDKSGIGLSMRGMGELKRVGNFNEVQRPLYIITFDSVSLPSHKAAVVDFNEMRFESYNVLTESVCSGVICTPDGRCYLPDYFDKLVETKVIQFNKRWI